MRALRVRSWLISVAFVGAVVSAAALQLGSRTSEEWVKTLDAPQRVAGLKIPEVVASLGLKPGQIVADVGAGSGLFEGALAGAVAPNGTVYAVDIQQGLLDHISKRAADLGVTNVRVVLGKLNDPSLPIRNVDMALIYDVLHHIEGRAEYLKNLAGYIAPAGRIAIVEYHPGKGHPDLPEMHVSKEEAAAWMAAAGFKPTEEFDLFADKWFVVYSR
jgi:ubiquinone/menaquinone biosynthesis C-methylase UbiE